MLQPEVSAVRIEADEAKSGLDQVMYWGFALVWWAALAGTGVLIFSGFGDTPIVPVVLVFAPFVLAGMYLVRLAVRETRHAFGARRMTVHLSAVPPLVGGTMRGEIHSPRPRSGRQSAVTLKCLERFTSSDIGDHCLWEDIHAVDAPASVGGRRAWPFVFEIPFEARETAGGEPRIYWSLALLVDRKPVASFEVPVFRTKNSSSEMTREWIRAHRIVRQPADGRIVIRPEGDRIEVDCAPPSSWSSSVLVAFLAVGCAVFMTAEELDQTGMPSNYAVAAYAAVAIIAAVAGWLLPVVLLVGQAKRILASPEGLKITFVSPLQRDRFMAAGAIGEISADPSASGESYVVIHGADRTKFLDGAMVRVKDAQEAEWLLSELRRALMRAV